MKRALVTGASSGIGRGTALRLAQDGWHVVGQGRRTDALDDTGAKVEAAGGVWTPVIAELGDMDDIARLAGAAGEELDAFVHCAATFTYGEVSTDRFDDWDRSIDAVLRATIRLTAHVLPALKQREGTVVYICGPTSWLGWKRHAIHCALRHAQAGFAKALFEDVREDGVSVGVVHPGFVDTGQNRDDLDAARMIQVPDIAEAIRGMITMPNTTCVTEIRLMPQRSPYV